MGVNDPTNNCQHTDIIDTTLQQQKIATPQNSPSINVDTNDSFQKKEDISDLTKESRSKQKKSNDQIQDVSLPDTNTTFDKQKEEKERVAREQAAKEVEDKRKEEKERIAREQATKEAEAKRKEDKEKAAREQAAKEAEAKRKEEKERAAREKAAKEAEAKQKEEKEKA